MAFREDSYWNRPLYTKKAGVQLDMSSGGLISMMSADKSISFPHKENTSDTENKLKRHESRINQSFGSALRSKPPLPFSLPVASDKFEEAPDLFAVMRQESANKIQQRMRNPINISQTQSFKVSPPRKGFTRASSPSGEVEAAKLQDNMEAWMKSCTSSGPAYSYEMSRVGGADYWRSGDPPPYPISLTVKQREAITISSTAPSFDALFSNTAEHKFRMQLEKEERHWPDNEKMRDWITKRMLPLEANHLLTTDVVNMNAVLTDRWKRHCTAPHPVPAQPLYDYPNTYPQAHISSFPHTDSDHLFSTFTNNKAFIEGRSVEYNIENRMSTRGQDDEGTTSMRPEFRTNRQLMPWLEHQNLVPSDPNISSDKNYVPQEVAETLFMRDDELWDDTLKGYSLADRLAHHRRRQKEKRKLPQPRWLNWDEVMEGT